MKNIFLIASKPFTGSVSTTGTSNSITKSEKFPAGKYRIIKVNKSSLVIDKEISFHDYMQDKLVSKPSRVSRSNIISSPTGNYLLT